MPIASGFIVVIDNADIERIKGILEKEGIEVVMTENEKIVYLIERNNMEEIEKTLKYLKGIDGIENVYLAYYTLVD